ncbi:AAA family ATPase [Streptomyces sp. 5K101]|uniref:AAA family ATPase n=1 Tax=Streptomyces sp. 5K101 TaxID=3390037 RepID=UPI003976A3C8
MRDRQASDDAPTRDLLDFLQEADDVPEWVIPGVLARWDRLMITAGEGGGKSLLLRQILMRAAAGLHPWKRARIEPVRVLLVDAENADAQVRPWLRRMADAAADEGAPIGRGHFHLEVRPDGLDLTAAADRAWLARTVERVRPDLISIGPLYKITTNGASDEEAARPLMSALEMIRTASNGAAMVLEAHSPHASMGKRIDSSLWLRWPEFGFGLSPGHRSGSAGHPADGLGDLARAPRGADVAGAVLRGRHLAVAGGPHSAQPSRRPSVRRACPSRSGGVTLVAMWGICPPCPVRAPAGRSDRGWAG